MKKWNIPIDLIENFEPLIRENLDVIKMVPNSFECYYQFEYPENPNFFFSVSRNIDYDHDRGTRPDCPYEIHCMPINIHSVSEYTILVIDSDEVCGLFNDWLYIVKKYHSVESISDGNIERQYAKEFFQKFDAELTDPDANHSAFSIEQQKLIRKHIEDIILALPEATDITNEIRNEIKQDAELLLNETSRATKNEVMRKWAKLYAKIQYHSYKLMEKIFEKGGDVIIKKLVEKAIDHIPTILS